MKHITCILIVLVTMFSCNYPDKVKSFIPGTYIRFGHHEYGTEYDTLNVALQNEASNEYRVTRNWKYERVLDGVNVEPEYKRQVTTCIYDLRKKLLRESETGLTYSFDPKHDILFAGSTEYKKIK